MRQTRIAAAYLNIGRMDDAGRQESCIHRLDARVKAVVTIVFIITVVSFPPHAVSSLIPLALYPLIMVAAGGIPVSLVLSRLALAAPFALAVAACNPLLDRRPVMEIGGWVLSAGWISFFSIMTRFVLTVSAVLALVACTGIHRLCNGLEGLRVPRPVTLQIALLYRYLFVIGGEGVRMTRAVQIRSAGPLRLRAAIPMLGTLLLRALDRAQRVYQAMRARGFDGHAGSYCAARAGWGDMLFLIAWPGFFICARSANLARMLGDWLARGGG